MEKGSGKPPFLAGLTGFRSLAVLAVLLGHAVAWIAPLADLPLFFSRQARLTEAGLSGFFVLSGFVLFYNHAPGPGRRPFDGKRFFLARLARIYPVYLLLLLVGLAVFLVQEPSALWRDPLCLPALASLTQTWFFAPQAPAVFPIGWAVSTEAFFYVLFPLLLRPVCALRSRRAALVVLLTAWGAALAVDAWIARSWPALFAWALDGNPGYAAAPEDLAGLFFQWLTYTGPYVRLFEFVLGMVAARFYQLGGRVPAWLGPAALAGLAMLWAAPFPADAFFLSVLANNALYAPCLVALCLAFAGRAPAFADWRPVKALARASLSVYLLQPFTLEPWAALTGPFPGFWPLAALAGMALTVALGLVLARRVEEPAARRLLRRRS